MDNGKLSDLIDNKDHSKLFVHLYMDQNEGRKQKEPHLICVCRIVFIA
jgi:predicted transposase YbfD/YdcC